MNNTTNTPHTSDHDHPFDIFVIVWNQIQGLTTPAMHIRVSRWLENKWIDGRRSGDGSRLLLMAFRSSGKSTIVGLFVAWLLYRLADLRILILAADQSLAVKMTRNVKKIIERHPLTGHLKPKSADQWAARRFTVNRPMVSRDPSVLAHGIKANITGTRADVIICDDVEVPNTSDTPEKRRDLRRRLIESEFILVPGGCMIYVGTPHSHDSIYAHADQVDYPNFDEFLNDYDRLEIPIINDLGQSPWPDRFPMAEIDRLKQATGDNKFASQMMLQPVSSIDSRLDIKGIRLYDHPLDLSESAGQWILHVGGRRMKSVGCWWDPAFGTDQNAGRYRDNSVIAAVFTDDDGGYFLHAIRYLKTHANFVDDPATQKCRQIARFIDRLAIPEVAVEINGIGRFLPGLLRQTLAKQKVHAGVIEKVSRKSKDIRILEAFDSLLAARRLHIHQSVYDTLFMDEMREWRPGLSNADDDGLDAVAGAISLEPVRLTRIGRANAKPSLKGVGQHRKSDDFDPLSY